jgi:Arc/MetJ family transcription regulator
MLTLMRTTLDIDDELLREAQLLTGLRNKTALVRAGLKALIARESAKRLVALGGRQGDLRVASRRRPQQDYSKSG